MISLPHIISISNATVHFLRSGKSLIFPPIFIKASFWVSEDRGRISWRMDSVESNFVTSKRILSHDLPHLMMRDALLTELDRFTFSFTSYRFLLFSATMRHWYYITKAIYILEEESGFILHPLFSTGVLLIRTILCIFISLLTVLIWWRGRTVEVLTVSYTAALMRIFLYDIHLTFSLSTTIDSVVMTSSISICTILAFVICSISSTFSLFDCLVPSRQAWWLESISGG